MVVVYCCKLRLIELPTLSTPPKYPSCVDLKKEFSIV